MPVTQTEPIADEPVTPAATPAQTDADAVRAARETSPAAAAHTLAEKLQANPDPAYQRELLSLTSDVVTELAQTATADDGRPGKDELQSLVDGLCDAAAACQPEQARALADAFAAGLDNELIGDDDDELGGVLRRATAAGHGALFGVELANSLQAAGKGKTAVEAAKFTTQGIEDAREDFEEARDKVAELTADVQGIAQDLAAAGRTPEEIADVIADFKQRHAAEFQAFEDTGARLSSTLTAVAQVANDPLIEGRGSDDGLIPWGVQLKLVTASALRDLPDLARTQAGSKAIADALAAQGRGQTTFLDAVPQLADSIRKHDGDEKADAFLDAVSEATLESAGTAAAAYSQAGDTASSDAILAGVARNTKLFRVDANTLAKITSNLRNVSSAKGPEAIKTAYAALQESTSGLSPKLALKLKAAGAAFGVVALVAGAPNLSEADLNQKLQYVLGATGTGIQVADVAGTAAGLVQKSTSFAKFAGFAGRAVPALTAAVSALSAFEEFSNGEVVEGAADAAIAAGAALLLTPPPGDIAGAILIAGGTLVKLFKGFFSGEGDGGQEADTKAALIRLGVPEAKAEQLKDLENGRHYIGQFIGAESRRLGVSPQAYLDWLVQLPDDDLERLMSTAREISTHDGKLKDASELGDPVQPPASVEAADAYLVSLGLYPPSTRAGYAEEVEKRLEADAVVRQSFSSVTPTYAALELSRNEDPIFRAQVIRRFSEIQGEFKDAVRILLSSGGDVDDIRESLNVAHDAGVISDEELAEGLEVANDW